ncbi:MAG: ribosome maturation factor RimP [Candidatus Nanopelagicales bacterium]|nr:ribosome maturation factor RimP [Candidatus Nanopelagicales bacterium]MDZ4250140.1 ribosome maturation factor RimP [Candidatus Nanopelagicales bacterium]
MASDLAERLTQVIAGPLSDTGAELEEVRVLSAGGRRLLRVAVDTPTGITLDELAAATRVVSAALEDSPHLGKRPYVLEVSSPGVDRPLTAPSHWRRNVGRLVRVLAAGETIIGRIRGVDERASRVVLDEVESGAGERSLPLDSIERAVVQVEFKRRDETEE